MNRMGNKLSCSCAPLIRKAYRYEDSPWQAGARGGMGGSGARRGDTGHLLRCGSLRERKRCAYHTIQPFNHSIRLHYQSLLFWEGYLLLSSNTLIPTSSTEHVHIHAHVHTHVYYTSRRTTVFIFSGRTYSLGTVFVLARKNNNNNNLKDQISQLHKVFSFLHNAYGYFLFFVRCLEKSICKSEDVYVFPSHFI